LLKFDERFFRFNKCVYHKKTNTVVVHFFATDNFESEIPRLEKSIIRQLNELLNFEKVIYDFSYEPLPPSAPPMSGEDFNIAIEKLRAQNEALPMSFASRIDPDKTLPMHDIEYWLGAPIKMRPIKIKYLRTTAEPQVTGGTMHAIKKREYTREIDGEKVVKFYYTFTLYDGSDNLQCVFFPSDKTRAKFEKLVERSVVCIIGTNEKRDNRSNFRVTGVSLCEQG